MMSEYYDHYHRWEPLAEFQFTIHDDPDEFEDNYVYCLCSRVFLRDGVKTYYAEKEYASESDVEVLRDSQSQEWDDHSHVHFSLDTSYKVKCEKDEGASCYCSASHTDNYCSTDEHDPAQIHGASSHALQPSDSGADLTYQDCHSDYTHDQLEKMDQDFPSQSLSDIIENYLSEDTWEKFWAVNGERIIWASWIKKYSDYINPAYLDQNNELVMDDNNIPKQHSADQIFSKDKITLDTNEDSMRERKFSYDSKVNPYKKSRAAPIIDKGVKNPDIENKDDTWFPLARKRSCSEHDRIISPRTVGGTDSMTNITKITLSSYDITSSHVTSESTPTDDYSVSSSTSDDQSNDQTRIININENVDSVPSEELDTEQYWQFLWKKHFGEQYALHYANYVECHDAQGKDLPEINVEMIPEVIKKIDEKPIDIECENSEGNSQEMPSVIEVKDVLNQIDEIKLEDKVKKPKKRNKKTSNRYLGSVGVLLQNLLKEEQKNSDDTEVFEGADTEHDKAETVTVDVVDGAVISRTCIQPDNVTNCTLYNDDDGDDEPPEEKSVSLKRSHEIDEEEIASEKVKSTFEIMGFSTNHNNIPKGQLVYRKRLARLRPPRYKRFGMARKTYFDEDGNPCQAQDSYDERVMQTDEEMDKTDIEKKTTNLESESADIEGTICNLPANYDGSDNRKDVVSEAAEVELPPDLETSFSDAQDNNDDQNNESAIESAVLNTSDTTKRRRRNKRHSRLEDAGVGISGMPPELKDDSKMFKYWKKRHSLFHRFDEGIKLDRESWFSVTPEQVARHIATKYTYEVVLDAFCGAGGNTIQFANFCRKVIAVDIDPAKIEMAKHNAEVYGVADRIEFIVGDFFELAPTLQADMIFLSPPWGGPTYSKSSSYDLETMLEPKPASELIATARTISSNITLYVPRNTRSDQLLSLAKTIGGSIELEQSYLDRRFVAITAYFYSN
ncbi:trimethylguanosine synthase isoform X2 [Galleria mellonella]|uniref:Trimethylguanosine synthase n=1 Tax=Galleria mellonella TaxID=7137 RepID=A0A6J1X0W3_GALME|nr:trimethylguanosine synthase isoform X2 [Galleria mellonella]